MAERDAKELVLALGDYAQLQDLTTGTIKLYTGPAVINQSAQEAPVKYIPKVGFERVADLTGALCKSVIAVEGYYLVLFNPVKTESSTVSAVSLQPGTSLSGKASPILDVGKRINIPGPVQFPLWPGQSAHYVRGHHLRTNEYLKIQVYNADEAKQNWGTAILQKVSGTEDQKETLINAAPPSDLTVGKTYTIKGTEVSFYIPPTGIKVLSEKDDPTSTATEGNNPDRYVREALTLERLEYCVLVDEDGNKRYEIGPKVVFPEPTEEFVVDQEGSRKFRALELNPIQGIHVKAIANIDEEIADSDPNGNTRRVKPREGDELFITGKQTAIFYPRAELSLVRYDGKSKHFATAIPEGEARYVLERNTGVIKVVVGPAMCLPDPRTHVFVHRALSDREVRLWYPYNEEARKWNAELRKLQTQAPTTNAGIVSDSEMMDAAKTERGGLIMSGTPKNQSLLRARASDVKSALLMANAPLGAVAYPTSNAMMDSSVQGEVAGQGKTAEAFSRRSTYTEPRSIQLDTKFQGVPTIDVWDGYAVLVKSKTGRRLTVLGPRAHLMGFDETLATLELSTGKPKSTDTLFETSYLNVKNNKVTDIVKLETSDHVIVEAKIIYRVNFQDEYMEKWFSVNNYVKYMCDHVRSVLKGSVQKMKIADFYGGHTEIIRDVVLGQMVEKEDGAQERPGMLFEENGMLVLDVDVLKVEIVDQGIKQLLDGHQHQVVKSNIELEGKKHEREVTEQRELLSREINSAKAATSRHTAELQVELLANELLVLMKRVGNQLADTKAKRTVEEALQETMNFTHGMNLIREKAVADQENEIRTAQQALELERLVAEADAVCKRFGAVAPGLSSALTTLSEHDTATKIAQALSVQTLLGGKSFTETWTKLFAGTPLESTMSKLMTQRSLPENGVSA